MRTSGAIGTSASVVRLPCFYLMGTVIGLLPWIVGALAFGRVGFFTGLATSFLGIMLLNDANKRHMAEQRRRLRNRMK